MNPTNQNRIAIAVTAATALLLITASVLLGVSTLTARERGPGLPPRKPVPRPEESSAKDVESARSELSRNKDLASVIQAAEAGDIDGLLGLAVSGGDDYCSLSRELPPECSSRDEKLDSVMLNQPRLRPIPVDTLKEWLSKLVREAGRPTLAFASRDSRTPQGEGGEYYLFFKAPAIATFPDGYSTNGIGIKVKVGAPKPIQWFELVSSQIDALEWIQVIDPENGAKYHILITPPSVKEMKGLDE